MDSVEEIKSRLSIEDVVGRSVDLKRSGASYKGLCPFHAEKTPSFYVTPARGTFHCFGCGKGGDIFTFEMEAERVDFGEALKRLAAQAGVTLPERSEQQPSLKKRLFEANDLTARFYAEMLRGEPGARARHYLQERHFGPDAWNAFDLGYAPNARGMLMDRLHAAGFDDRLLLDAGLAFQDDVGGQARDRFRGRLMFPIRDANGRIVGFGGRALDADAQPKYLNSPQTEIFDKSGVLFGIHLASETMRTERRAVLVEGYLDAVRAHLAGYRTVVASLGTAVTEKQLGALSRMAETVVLALDPDPAGQAAAARTSLTALAEVTRQRGRAAGAAGAVDLRIARLPMDGGDPDDLIRVAPVRWEEALAGSVPAFEFFYIQTMSALDRSSDGWRQEAIDRLLPPIEQFAMSAGWQATWLERLARDTGIDPRTLQRSLPAGTTSGRTRRKPELAQAATPSVVTTTTARGLTDDPVITVERALLALLVKLIIIPDETAQALTKIQWDRPEHRNIAEAVLAWRETGNYDFQMLRETLPEGAHALADELYGAEVPLPAEGKFGVAVAFHLERLHRFRLDAQLGRTQQLLQDLPPEDKLVGLQTLGRLMSEINEVERRLDHLSQLVVQSGSA